MAAPVDSQTGEPVSNEQADLEWQAVEKALAGKWSPAEIAAYKKQFYEKFQVKPGTTFNQNESYEYGGQAGGDDYWNRQFGGVSERSLAQQDKFYGQQEQQLANAMEDRGRALDARGAQNRVADLMWNRASGRVPSIAQMQADRQMGQLAAEQTSQAASARGPAALALAQQNQANATATGQSAISGQAQINAAMERERAEQAAFGAYSGMRGQDYQGQQLSQQGQGIALQGAGQAGSQATAYSQLQHGVNTSQLQAQGNKEGQRSANKFGQAAVDAQRQARNDAKDAGYMSAGVNAGIGLAMMASDERAKMPVGRSPGIAPQESFSQPTYEASRQAAHQALAAEEQREAKARAYGTPQTTGPATHGGIAALDRYEQDQVDTIRAKERHGVPLDAKETRMAEAAKRGQKYGDKRGTAEMREQPQKLPAGEAQKPDGHEKEKEPSTFMKGLGAARSVAKDLLQQPTPAPNYNFYTAPQQQQITSDMGAKRRVGLHDFMSDMGTKLPYSDERAKTNVSFGFGDDGGGAKSRISPNRREAMEEEADPNAKWVGLMKNAPGIPTKEGPDAGYGHMFSDMGTKQAPMWSDDQTKLAKAWEQGRKAGLQDAGQRSGVADFEREQKASQPKREADNRRRAVTDAQLATKRAAAPHLIEKAGPGRDQSPAMARAEKLTSNIAGKGASLTYNALENGELTSQEPHELRSGGFAARLRAGAAAARQPQPQATEPSSVPPSGTGSPGHREDEAEVFSDERAKQASSWADRELANVRADDERESKRPPAVGSQHVSDEAMAQAARSMEASPYAYKPEFKPEEQAPGEVNVGPMAQKMEKSPIAATAVRKDPQTGLRSLDRDKLIKVQGGILASQQKQIDDIKARQMMREADRQIGNYKADRPAATNARQDAMMRQADEQIRNYRTERPASVIDRGQDGPPSWLQKYMVAEGDPEEEKGTRKRRLTSADFITRRRKA